MSKIEEVTPISPSSSTHLRRMTRSMSKALRAQGQNDSQYIGSCLKLIGRPTDARLTLPNMTRDVILVLFECLDECTATCLGLTSKDFWLAFEFKHPERSSLIAGCEAARSSGKSHQNIFRLGELLQTWMGPRFRDWMFNDESFLARDIYGDNEEEGGVIERRLRARYDEYYITSYLTKKNPPKRVYRLPSQNNLGSRWYAQAFRIIADELYGEVYPTDE